MLAEHEPATLTSAAPAIRWSDVMRAEVTKIVTDPAVPLVCLMTLVVNTGLFTLAASGLVRLSTGDGLVRLADLGQVMFSPVYLFLVVPAFAAGNEYVSGQHRVTLTATPNRTRLATAKAAAMGAVVLPAAVLVVLPGRLVLTVTEGESIGDIVLDIARWTSAYTLMSCVAYGLATLLRSRVAAIAILALVPLLLATGVLPWPQLIRLLPDQLSLSLVGAPGFEVTATPVGTAAALLAAWAVIALSTQAAAVIVRDS